jgi:hypothetical protein
MYVKMFERDVIQQTNKQTNKSKVRKLTVCQTYNPKGKYKIEYAATWTTDECEGRIRGHGGVSILL